MSDDDELCCNNIQMQWRLSHEKLWERKLDDPINCLEVGKPFLEELSEENDILIGTTAGRVLILNQDKVGCPLTMSVFFYCAALSVCLAAGGALGD